jgi:hypothetical protein
MRHIGRHVNEVPRPASAVNSRCSPQRMRARPRMT